MVHKFIKDYDVLILDFVGCGLSKGEYVTLGLDESKDIESIITHVINIYKYEEIYLWGRSMGAVSIIHLLYNLKDYKRNYKLNQSKIEQLQKTAKTKPSTATKNNLDALIEKNSKIRRRMSLQKYISAIVLDAPFTCAYKMISNIVKSQANTNSITTYMAMTYLKRSLRNNIGRDIISENKPEKLVKYIDVPAAFLLGEHDELVSVNDLMSMFNTYGSEFKRFRLMVDTDHPSSRNDEDLDAGLRFIAEKHKNILETKSQTRVSTTVYSSLNEFNDVPDKTKNNTNK